MRILRTLALLLLALVGTALLVLYVRDPYLATRLVGLAVGGDDLGPLETVKGGPILEIPVAAPGQGTVPPAALDAAVAYGTEMDSHALLVWHRGSLQLEHYYPGYSADTRTATQSMHKSVLALLVGLAIRDGFIASVDDRASQYIPEWAGDARREITLRQMLRQESGIDFPGLPGFAELTLGGDIAPIVLGQGVLAPAGTQFDYNGINPQVLGILIQRVSGRRYAEYLSQALWQHLGVPDATVVLDSEETAIPRTFCCLNATARSWLQLGLLHLHQGRVGDRQVVPAEWMADVVTPGAHNPNYGYLTWLGNTFEERRRYNRKSSAGAFHSEPFVARDVIFFDGFGGQRVYVIPSRELVIVRTGALKPDFDDAKLPNLLVRAVDAASGTTPAATSPAPPVEVPAAEPLPAT